MGELHLEIIVDRLLREFKVEANVGAPQVSYNVACTPSTGYPPSTPACAASSIPSPTAGIYSLGIAPPTTVDARRGRIEGMDDIGGGKIVRGYVPLAEMFGYSTDLRSKTQGRGNYSMLSTWA